MGVEATLLTNFYKRKISRSLGKLQEILGCDIDALATRLNLSGEQLEEVLKGRRSLDVESLRSISSELCLDVQDFINSLDKASIQEHIRGEKFLHSKYLLEAHSQKAMVTNVIKFVQKKYSTKHAFCAMDAFNFDRSLFENIEDEKVNYLLFEDLCNFLKRLSLTDKDIFNIGLHMPKVSAETSFGKKMRCFNTPRDLYEVYLCELLDQIEQNNQYKLMDINDHNCVLRSYERPQMQEAFRTKNIGGRNRCIYRTGALAAATSYIGLPYAFVKESKCVHYGDQFCEFFIDYSFLGDAKTREKANIH